MDALHAKFLRLSEKIAELLLTEAILAVPFENPELIYFNRLETNQKTSLLQSLEAQVQLMEDLPRNGLSLLRNTKTFLFSYLSKMGLTTLNDLPQLIEDLDYVAVYNLEQQMIFLSPNHFTWLSYTMEDLLCRPWFELFKRSPEIEKLLRERAFGFVTGQMAQTQMNTDLPAHQVTETLSVEKRVVTGCSKLYSPLFKKAAPAGFIAVNQSRIMQNARKKSASTLGP